jgi:hypothetical protein
VAAACAASIAPRGASAQFLSVPDTFLSSTDPSAPCPVDVDRLRLDPTLGQACDANVQGDRLCEACVCDIALRLAEAGYAVAGPDAVPFQACAFQNLLALQQRGGITIGGMLEVSRRCDYAPPCINEISEDFFGDEDRPTSPRLRRRPMPWRRPHPSSEPKTTSTRTVKGKGASSPASSRRPRARIPSRHHPRAPVSFFLFFPYGQLD